MTDKRFRFLDSPVPGPGQYKQGGEISASGTYFISKFNSSGATRFGRSMRSSLALSRDMQDSPGPGSYNMQSEFGYITLQDSVSNDQQRVSVGDAKMNSSRASFNKRG